MGIVSFTLGFQSAEMNALDLPVEVRTPDAALVASTGSSAGVELPAGDYYVTATLPAGQRITRAVEVGHGPAEVRLEPDPEDGARHDWDEERHFLDRARPAIRPAAWAEVVRSPALAADAADEAPGGGAASIREADPRTAGTPLLPGRAYLRVVSGNVLRGEHVVEPVDAVLVPRERQGVAYFQVDTRARGPVVVQLLEVDAPALNMVVPQSARLALSLRPASDRFSSRFKLEAFTSSSASNLLLRYARQGAYQRAADVAVSARLLAAGLEDPVAVAIAAYGLLRTGDVDRLHDWTAAFARAHAWLPDGAAVHGECLAKLGRHAEALAAFAELPDRGLPIVADGVFYTVERLKTYAQLAPSRSDTVDVALAKAVLEPLNRFATVVHRQRPLTSFPGLDPRHPDVRPLRPGQIVDEALEVSLEEPRT